MMRLIFAFLAFTSFACGSGGSKGTKEVPQTVPVGEKPTLVPTPVQPQPEPIKNAIPYPKGPELTLTPGSLCTIGEQFRYAENIRYCEREVLSETKNAIIANYDQTYGYRIGEMPRLEFKVDHFIPLCMGGSNELDNLWPQHEEMFVLTDKVESRLCDLMSKEKIQQAEAVELIKWVKFNFAEAPRLMEELARVMKGEITATDVTVTFLYSGNAR